MAGLWRGLPNELSTAAPQVIAPLAAIIRISRNAHMLPLNSHLPAMHRPKTPQWWSNSVTQRLHVWQWCVSDEPARPPDRPPSFGRHTRQRTQ